MSRDDEILTLHEVGRSFGGFRAVNDLTFAVHRGEVTGLVGPNGAGKTTIINIISGVLAPSEGTVELNGRRISGLPAWRTARLGLARSFQDLKLYGPLSVRDNVASVAVGRGASLRRARRDAGEILERFELDGLATRPAESLSYAESKRLSLARTFVSGPKVALLDEPASGLDEQSTNDLIRAIRELSSDQGVTILIVEHNLDLIRAVSDRIAFLVSGHLQALGSPEEIFARKDLAEIYFGAAGGGNDN